MLFLCCSHYNENRGVDRRSPQPCEGFAAEYGDTTSILGESSVQYPLLSQLVAQEIELQHVPLTAFFNQALVLFVHGVFGFRVLLQVEDQVRM